jgi:hypothetical protein
MYIINLLKMSHLYLYQSQFFNGYCHKYQTINHKVFLIIMFIILISHYSLFYHFTSHFFDIFRIIGRISKHYS